MNPCVYLPNGHAATPLEGIRDNWRQYQTCNLDRYALFTSVNNYLQEKINNGSILLPFSSSWQNHHNHQFARGNTEQNCLPYPLNDLLPFVSGMSVVL